MTFKIVCLKLYNVIRSGNGNTSAQSVISFTYMEDYPTTKLQDTNIIQVCFINIDF